MDIVTTPPKAYPLESIDSSSTTVTETSPHCDHHNDRRRSSNSDTDDDDDASSSCNFRPLKLKHRRRKVFKTTMALDAQHDDPPVVFRERLQEDPYEHDYDRHELTPEEKRIRYFASILYRNKPSKQLFDTAAELLKATPLVKKSLSDCFFSGTECDVIAQKLREQHNIVMSYTEVRSNLNAAYYAFEEYCLLMKMGREVLRFDRETGNVYIQGTYSTYDPIVEKHANIKRTHMDAILYFSSLKAIFPFLWDKYFRDGSKKRSGSGSSKRSKETSSLKSSSSVNANQELYGQVIDRLQELFGDGPSKELTKAYADAAELHYSKDQIECCTFLAYEDDDAAKAAFASKTNIHI